MIPRHQYLIKPVGSEYNNTKTVGGVELTVNATIENAKFVNRIGEVVSVPDENTELQVGDLVVVHHNVFRTYLDMRGRKRKSNEYFRDGLYLVNPDRIYLYNRNNQWKAVNEYCFVRPIDYIQGDGVHRTDRYEDHVGEIVYGNKQLTEKGVDDGDLIGFIKDSEYVFEIGEEKLYRMKTNDICLILEKTE